MWTVWQEVNRLTPPGITPNVIKLATGHRGKSKENERIQDRKLFCSKSYIGTMIGLASTMVPGIAIGVVGLDMALSTYPIYKKILNSREKKYAPEILALSEKIMNN